MTSSTGGTETSMSEGIALQLYTVRDRSSRDMLGTLRQVAAMGYRAVEFAGYGGLPAAEVAAELSALGLTAPAAHVGLADLESKPTAVFADMRALGCEFVVVPWVAEERRADLDAVRALAATLNTLGAACRDEGLRLAYHNHAFEFAPLGGGLMWDVLAAETDPALVALELDIYWAAHAGANPERLIEAHPGRLPLLHIKDMAAGPQGADVPVGDGVLPWPALLRAGIAAGARWFIVEQDHPGDSLVDVERSLRALQPLLAEARGAA
jgi:sugar phosphate isomerase/epimerase